MSPRNVWLGVIIAMGCLATAACGGRAHLARGFGDSYHAHFALQAIHPDAGNKAPVRLGLDSQEAAIVAESYRRSLMPEGSSQQGDEQPMIIVAPPAKGSGQTKLAPSVPSDR
jgi:hypothetical protein